MANLQTGGNSWPLFVVYRLDARAAERNPCRRASDRAPLYPNNTKLCDQRVIEVFSQIFLDINISLTQDRVPVLAEPYYAGQGCQEPNVGPGSA